MHTIAIANQKGGCGKTTVAINLSASLAREGRRTVLVDLDPQAHCALGMAVPEEQIDLSILDCLLGQVDKEPVELSRITWQIAPNLDVAPSRPNLAGLEPKLTTQRDAESLLRNLLAGSADRYDYCVIDCPPHLGLLMRNGLRAADNIIIPVDTGYFSLYGLTQQLSTIDHLSERSGFKPSVHVLANQYDVRTKLGREILAELRKRFRNVLCETIINFNTKLKEGASFGQPITEFAPNSMGARDFQRLAREVIAKEPVVVPTADLLQHVEKLTADAERLLATTTVLVDNRSVQGTDSIPAGQASPLRKSTASMAGRMATEHPTQPSASGKPASRTAPPTGSPKKEPVSALAQVPGRSRTTQAAPGRPAAAASRPTRPRVVQPPVTRLPDTGQSPPKQVAAHPMPESTVQSKPTASGPTTILQDAKPVSPRQETASHAVIDRKIEAVYGARQEGDVVIFRSHSPDASEVQLAGDFNDWMPHTTPMWPLAKGDFEARLRLPKGRYRYRLVIDGRWSHDRQNPVVETNEYGELNSIVEVTR